MQNRGGNDGLLCDTLSKWDCLYPMPHYGHGCNISTLLMVPINFWRNFDLLKKEHFSSLKIYKVSAFQRKSLKFFKEYLSKKPKIFETFLGLLGWFCVSNLMTLGSFGSEMNNLGWSFTYQQSCPINYEYLYTLSERNRQTDGYTEIKHF